MPTPVTAKFPRTKDADEFENLVLELLSRKWKVALQRNGRNGQAQNGVDIYGERDGVAGAYVGVQCKNVDALALAVIEAEVASAESFTPSLCEYWVVTGSNRDARLQEQVRQLSMGRRAQGKFPVNVWFWDDIELELGGHSELVVKFYGAMPGSDGHERQVKQRALALVRVANAAAQHETGSRDAWCSVQIPLKDALDVEAAYSLQGDPKVLGVTIDEANARATFFVNRSGLPDDLILPRRSGGGWPFS